MKRLTYLCVPQIDPQRAISVETGGGQVCRQAFFRERPFEVVEKFGLPAMVHRATQSW
jgi:hypothetical protein